MTKEYELSYLQGRHQQCFEIINLEENHRQGNDKKYADVLNRIRVGNQTEQDIELLKTRIRQPTNSDINNGNDALFIAARNKDVKKFNDEHMKQVDGEEFTLEAVHIHQTMKKLSKPNPNST